MLRVFDLFEYLKANFAYTFNINEFTSSAPDDSATVRITPGFSPSEWTPKKQPSFQIVIRSDNPQTAESKAYEIYQHFHNKIEFSIGTTRIIKSIADQSAPLYLGQDDNNRYLYSVNFTVTTI